MTHRFPRHARVDPNTENSTPILSQSIRENAIKVMALLEANGVAHKNSFVEVGHYSPEHKAITLAGLCAKFRKV